MRLALSWLCYHLGNLWSLTFLQLGLGYRVYNRLMLWSSNLDTQEKIWKNVR